MPPKPKGVRARFEGNYKVAAGGCWEWAKCRDQNGYGRIQHDGRSQVAHRIAWELWVGPIPEGKCILHKCDNPSCINPDHLFVGTQLDNIADMNAKGRHGKFVHESESSPGAKLKWPEVREIRRRCANGELIYMVANDYGVSKTTVGYIIRRQTWRNDPNGR